MLFSPIFLPTLVSAQNLKGSQLEATFEVVYPCFLIFFVGKMNIGLVAKEMGLHTDTITFHM